MRTILYMTLALGLAAGGFALYLRYQGNVPSSAIANPPEYVPPMDVARPLDPNNPMGPGSRPSFSRIDRMGRLASKISCRDYDSLPGNRIQVRDPQVEFYQYSTDPKDNRIRTQRVRMVGTSGVIELAQAPKAPNATGFESSGMGGSPKRGTLRDVVIEITPDLPRPPITVPPSTIIRTPNISFDNETYEITTETYRLPDGTIVPSDQVPVEADGDYQFRGRGLTLRTNDVDGRLELLEIAHGEYLYVKDRSKMGNGMFPGGGGLEIGPAGPASPASPTTRPINPVAYGPLLDEQDRPIELAAGDKVSTARAAKDGKPAKGKKPPQPPYRASFDRDVRVAEGQMNVAEVQVAEADELHMEFQPTSKTGPTTRSTTAPSTRPAAPAAVVPPVALTPEAAAPAPVARPATQPATKPALPPGLIVRWTGKLRVVPIEPKETFTGVPMKPGESSLRLVGTNQPVRLNRENGIVTCTVADYFSADGSVALQGSEKFGQVVMRQKPDPAAGPAGRESVITTDSLNYNGAIRVATLLGNGHAKMALPATQPTTVPAGTAVAQDLDARWSRIGRLYMKEGFGGSFAYDRAVFEGDVDVKHPQMALKSQTLDLQFENRPAPAAAGKKSTTQPSQESVLKELVATTNVWCNLADASGRRQQVTTDRLNVRTETDATGRMYPKLINASGNAHAWDETQDLRAGNVELTLAPVLPTTRAAKATTTVGKPTTPTDSSEVELQTMRAWDGVKLKSADGAKMDGDRLDVVMLAGQPVARITGAPAVVTDPKGSVITGAVIDFDASRQVAVIPGSGSIRAIQHPEPEKDPRTGQPLTTQRTKPDRVIDIAWDGSAELNSAANLINVAGPLKLVTRDPDGTINIAQGNRARIELVDRPPMPTTRPASTRPSQVAQGARPTRPTSRPASGGGMLASSSNVNFMENKAVSVVHLQQDAVVNSTLSDATGILRQFEIKSQNIRYELGVTPTTQATASPLAFGSGGQGKIVVPEAGTLLYRDHRPPATQPANGDKAQPDQARGATAFSWKDSLVVDQSARKATMDGNVIIVHQSDEADAIPVRVDGDRAVALFESKPPTRPATDKASPAVASNTPGDDMAAQLRWLTIYGNLVVRRGTATLTADRMDYDPATGWLTAVGSQRNPATWTDTGRSGFVDQVQWNTRNWLPRLTGFRGRTGVEPPRR